MRPSLAQGLAALVVAGAALTVLATGPDDMMIRVAAVSAASILLFATRVLPEAVTAAATFLGFIALAAAPPEVIFSGFATGGFWLLFGGLVIGTAVTETGLGRQVADRIHRRTGASYSRAVWLLALGGLGLALIVPSAIPRAVVMTPIAVSLAEAMGYRSGSREQIGLAITAATATLLPTYPFLPANLPAIIEVGAIEALYGVTTTYGAFFLEQMPVNLVRFAVLVPLMILFARGGTPPTSRPEARPPEPLSGAQARLLLLLFGAVALWATDTWHGIAPAWIALGCATLVLWPAFGIFDATAMRTKIDLSVAFFLAAVFAVSAVAGHTGLADALAGATVPLLHLGEAGGLRDLYAITGLSILVSHLTTAPAAPVLLAPLAGEMATATGWPINIVSTTHLIGIATTILPYQAPPFILAIALGRIPLKPLTLVCAVLALAVLTLGMPLTWLWWRLLGLV
ncbi:SLC13 family permease [Histidinibacterium lentulum]|uniref:Citrate transporter-like domain-containing protein n=1 Tax=Histidinibacterium lentulum TaxID=2480588 RepID=A0A3N2RA22_9RHOB|nr:SLC13 family permease [Histidinibacterium lentulum]ROU04257.1 hypothetical protein EAT49_02375 [Histidinibacterium lentulum]